MTIQTIAHFPPSHAYQQSNEHVEYRTVYDVMTNIFKDASFSFDIEKTSSYQSLQELERQQHASIQRWSHRENKWALGKTQAEQKLELLKQALQEVKQAVSAMPSCRIESTHSIAPDRKERKITSLEEIETLEKIDFHMGRISSIQHNAFRLQNKREVWEEKNQLASLTCTSLQKQCEELREKQKAYEKQIQEYRDQVKKKEVQRDKTLAKEQEVNKKIDDFINHKKKNLRILLSNVDNAGEKTLSNLQTEFQNQRNRFIDVKNQEWNDLSKINQEALDSIQTLLDERLQDIQRTQNQYLQNISDELESAKTYVEGKCFTIRNAKFKEYLYAATYAPRSLPDRRYVFCWKDGREVTQGYWIITPHSNGTFSFKNTVHQEYLFASRYEPFSDAYPVRTWKKKEMVKEAYWRLKPLGNQRFSIYNTDTQSYLCVDNQRRCSNDDERRTVVAKTSLADCGSGEAEWQIEFHDYL